VGYSDIGCFGGEIATPNIDKLAAGGMRFTSFHNNAVCAPTRGSLMTGLDAPRAGHSTNNSNPADPFWKQFASPAYKGPKLDRTATVAELLRAAGYQTFMTGKWHLGTGDAAPTGRGFDRFFGTLWGGVNSQFKPDLTGFRLDDKPVTELPADFYTTDAFTDYAIRFIEEGDPGKPYFLYLSHTAPHTPWDARPEDIAKHEGKYDGNWDAIREQRFARQKAMGLFPPDTVLPARDISSARYLDKPDPANWGKQMARYAAMIDRIDQQVGRLVEVIRRRGELENTAIVFFCDNGQWALPFIGGAVWAETCNTPFRMFKGWDHQGGIATAFVAHWPGVIPAGTINRTQVGHVRDLAPTFLDMAGIAPPKTFHGKKLIPFDGQSLLKAFRDPNYAHNIPICWEMEGNGAIRDGRWKLVRSYHEVQFGRDHRLGPRTGKWELYDMETDPTESHDLAAVQPKRVREMAARYEAWAKGADVIPHEQIAVALEKYLKENPPKAK
jgi:arylsulfatase A-like enzyme